MTATRLRPHVVAFDVNETLLDLAPVRAALVEAGQPGHLLPAVFTRTLLLGFGAAAVGGWCRFRDAFDAALAQATDLGPVERGPLGGREVDVAVREPADEGDLEHQREPAGTTLGAAEQVVEDREIEQRLVDVEGDDPRHAS